MKIVSAFLVHKSQTLAKKYTLPLIPHTERLTDIVPS